MGYKTFASMNIAIIGSGVVSDALAYRLAMAGHEVLLAGKDEQEPVNWDLANEFDNMDVTTVGHVANEADIIIIATKGEDARAVAYHIGDVRRKVIIDATNILSHKTGEHFHTVKAITAITGNKNVVRCFNCMGFENFLNLVDRNDSVDMYVAGDSKKAKEIAKLLARDMGYSECFDFGGNETIEFLEDMARCWINLTMLQKKGAKIDFKLLRK
ncbi:MAG: NAD(P)-binding domain-containing protein [Bacteroidetes bacterium]|nr:NAD(P)-binding domain-containing protein [Bacteroidota bacterium]